MIIKIVSNWNYISQNFQLKIWISFQKKIKFQPLFQLQDEEEWEWRTRDELIHPSDRRRIIHVRVPRRSSTGQNGHISCENTYAGGASRLIRTTPTQSALWLLVTAVTYHFVLYETKKRNFWDLQYASHPKKGFLIKRILLKNCSILILSHLGIKWTAKVHFS